MNKLFTTLIAAVAMTASLPINGQTTQEGYDLYGHVSNLNDQCGIYQFTSNANADLNLVESIATKPNCGAVKVGDLYYVFNMETTSYGPEYSMSIYNTEKFEFITRHKLSKPMVSEGTPITYDAKNDKVYSVYKENDYNYQLCTLDLKRDSKTEIGSLSTKHFLTLAFNDEGNLYGITDQGELYKISTTDATTELVGNTTLRPMYQQAATFLPGDNKNMYWTATFQYDNGALYKVDVTNAACEMIKTFTNDQEFAFIWVGDKIIQAGAPSKSTNISAKFENGSTTGKVLFTAPTKTHSGDVLSGALTYRVLVDGEQKANGNTNPGENVQADVTTTQGTHDFVIVVSNENGDGEKAELKKQYIGKDTPKPVSNVKLERAANGTDLTLTWEGPTESVHGGYFDAKEVKYKIVQMPMNKVVETNATSPFTFQATAEKPENCFFDVIPYVDENTIGMPMSSNKLMIGEPFTVPYTESFDKNDDFLLFTIEHNGDGNGFWTWDYDNYWVSIYSSTEKDDWLFTPFIAVDKGTIYKLSFDVKTIGKEKFEVKLGNSPASTSMTRQLVADTEIDTDGKFITKECEFTSENDDIIYIGFHANTTNYEDAMKLYIDNIKLVKTGDTKLDAVSAIGDNADAPMYNLSGQRVGKGYKGIVIQNGKKFMSK